jgi:hypothetical protein
MLNSFIREHIVKRFTRSPKWSKVRKAYLKKHSKCKVCGGKKKLEVHHIKDFSTHPELELKFSNLLTLCRKRRCHLLFGHLNNWKSINPDVKEDVKVWRNKIKKRRKVKK